MAKYSATQHPFEEATDGWILGSSEFVERVRQLISPRSGEPQPTRKRNLPALQLEHILEAVCGYYGLSTSELAHKGSRHVARVMVAVLARKHTSATLAQIAAALGLSRRDCVPNLLRRAASQPAALSETEAVEHILLAGR